MAIPLPNLDDRTFKDLVEELRALIPRYAPEWTDHNVSDPGIMLIELFAWLAEAAIYRLNRVPDASEARFLELLGAVFTPARPVVVKLRLDAVSVPSPLNVPAGTFIHAINPGSSQKIPFETLYNVTLQEGGPGVVAAARQSASVEKEDLGISNGKPFQAFRLSKAFVLLEPDGVSPVVPMVLVDGEEWTFARSFMDSSLNDRHFTVDPRLNAISFGDGIKGMVPPTGARIEASYTFTLGKAGLVHERAAFVPSGELASFVSVSLEDGSVQEGKDPVSIQEARVQVAAELKRRWRAITADDFRSLLVTDPVEGLRHRIARVKCLPERDLTSTEPGETRPGHITVVIVPEPEDPADRTPVPSNAYLRDVQAILDERRLVTSRVHVTGPGYTDIGIQATVVCQEQTPLESVQTKIEDNLKAFFHPIKGGPEGKGEGWPFGRDVYPSEVFQVIEATEGVDHVENLSLKAREGDSWVTIAERVEIPADNLVNLIIAPGDIQVRVGV